MVYVTHDQTEAMTMAGQIIVLNEGRVEQAGSPIEIYAQPKNLFVAHFIGTPPMNMLAATFRRSSDELSVECANGAKVALPGRDVELADGAQVTLCIRPEHMEAGSGPSRSR